MNHAVVMRVKLPADPGEDGLKMLEEMVIPNAKAQEGFQNGTWMNDGSGNGIGITVFDTEENATAAQDALKPPDGGPELVSCDVYMVGAQA
jgi:hypothetical protein